MNFIFYNFSYQFYLKKFILYGLELISSKYSKFLDSVEGEGNPQFSSCMDLAIKNRIKGESGPKKTQKNRTSFMHDPFWCCRISNWPKQEFLFGLVFGICIYIFFLNSLHSRILWMFWQNMLHISCTKRLIFEIIINI